MILYIQDEREEKFNIEDNAKISLLRAGAQDLSRLVISLANLLLNAEVFFSRYEGGYVSVTNRNEGARNGLKDDSYFIPRRCDVEEEGYLLKAVIPLSPDIKARFIRAIAR